MKSKLIAVSILVGAIYGQPALRSKIERIASEARGTVSVACSLPGTTLNCDLNPHGHPPMQSVFKFPLVLTAFHVIETGRLSLDQPIRFLPSDRILPHTYSPLQDKYPNADVDVPLRELLRLAESLSDNAAADTVLRILGGPGVVDGYIKSLGVRGFHLEDNEATLHRDIQAQYRNWCEPAGMVELLRKLADDSPINLEHRELLFRWMRDANKVKRLRGLLPEGTIVMHKPGTSGTDNGLTHATNDVGLIIVREGAPALAIAVFVTDSKADEETRESVIARIAKAAFDETQLTKTKVDSEPKRR